MRLIIILFVVTITACHFPHQRRSEQATVAPTAPFRYMLIHDQIIDIENEDPFVQGRRVGLRLPDPAPGDNPYRYAQVFFAGSAVGYMDQDICNENPVMYVDGVYRWGPIMYDNAGGQRSHLEDQLKKLVDANCKDGQVEAITLRFFHKATPDLARGQGTENFFHHEGDVIVGERYQTVHDDEDGLNRYYAWNRADEDLRARLQRREEILDRWRGTRARSFSGYCQQHPAVCASLFALGITMSGRRDDDEPSGRAGDRVYDKGQCLRNCQLLHEDPLAVEFCNSTC